MPQHVIESHAWPANLGRKATIRLAGSKTHDAGTVVFTGRDGPGMQFGRHARAHDAESDTVVSGHDIDSVAGRLINDEWVNVTSWTVSDKNRARIFSGESALTGRPH
jgi:hypothetical protein